MKETIFVTVLWFCSASCTMPYFTTDTYPVTVFFTEGPSTPSGTIIHTFHAEDDETSVVPFLNYTYDPISGQNMFHIEETNTGTERTAVVTLKEFKEFDYETQDTYKITAYAFDGILLSDGVLLTIQINDTGEIPYLSPATDSQSFEIEENAEGSIIGSPSFTIVDTDGNQDYHTWTISGGNGSNFVSINPNNGTIVLAADYDRDNTSYYEDIYVDVNITDKYDLSVTTTYFIKITDKNDNIPQCDPTLYTFDIERNTSVGTILSSINCTDNDLTSPNNLLTYSFVSNSANTEYFSIDLENITLAYINDLIYGRGPYQLLVQVSDGGIPSYSSTVTLTFTIPNATTLPPTTTLLPIPVYDDISYDSTLPALIIIISIVGACIVGYIMILCWRWHTFGACLPRHCPTSQQCRMCCTCCPGDDLDLDRVLSDRAVSDDFMQKKGSSFGLEAPSSRTKISR
ncbi:hypothetical protein ACF0H5_022654 [Mactra antiquata]